MTWSDDTNSDAPDFGGESGFAPGEPWPADGLDRLIAETAREYNAPPPSVPRDAMWAAIVAARAPHAAAPAPVATGVLSLAEARRHSGESRSERDARAERAERAARNRGLWAVAAAAAIFLATGVGIGRWWGRGEHVATGRGDSARVAVAVPQHPAAAPTAEPSSAAAIPDRGAAETPDAARMTRLADADSPRRPGGNQGGRASALGAARPGAADPYDVAVMRHFAQAEALLVSYRADTVDATMDARLAAWARPLLGDTRLLLDSPAANDPRRRRLLEDLELVLTEVSRLAPPADSAAVRDSTARSLRTERQLIDGTLRAAQLLPRLRTVVPAGT